MACFCTDDPEPNPSQFTVGGLREKGFDLTSVRFDGRGEENERGSEGDGLVFRNCEDETRFGRRSGVDQDVRDGEGGPVRLDEIWYELVFKRRELDLVRADGFLSFRANGDGPVGGGKDSR